MTVLAFATTPTRALAAEIKGRITALQEGRIRIELEGGLRPKAGDPVKITWKLGERVLDAGKAEVEEVGDGFAMARVKEGNPNINMQAVIVTDDPQRPSGAVESRLPAPQAGRAAPRSSGEVSGVRTGKEIRVVQTSRPAGDDRWDWEIHLEGPDSALDEVRAVVYRLHPTFPDPDRRIDARSNGFQLRTNGWGTFTVKIDIEFIDGRTERREHHLQFGR
jgi:hypothetical protein